MHTRAEDGSATSACNSYALAGDASATSACTQLCAGWRRLCYFGVYTAMRWLETPLLIRVYAAIYASGLLLQGSSSREEFISNPNVFSRWTRFSHLEKRST